MEVPAGPDGTKGPFLTTLQWLPELGRIETLQEYHQRILTDLAECKRQLIAHNFPVPEFFAFPFSADRGTPEGTDILRQTVTSLYRAAMLDDADEVVATSSTNVSRGLVRRMDITAAITPSTLSTKSKGAVHWILLRHNRRRLSGRGPTTPGKRPTSRPTAPP